MTEDYTDLILEANRSSRLTISPHPTLPPECYALKNEHLTRDGDNIFEIGYFGEFYPNRGVGELVKAMDLLSNEDRSKIRLSIFTSRPENATAQIQRDLVDSGSIRINKSVSLFSFLALARQLDSLYVADVAPGIGYHRNPYLPSKVSDYKGAGTPILASVWPGSELSEDASVERFLLGDVKGLSSYLSDAIRALDTHHVR